jgi:hypothetical protein
LERILQVAEALSEVLEPSAKVSLREILPGVTKVLLRVLELVLEVVLTALIVVMVVAAIDAIVMMVVMVVTNCVTHRSFSFLLGVPASASCRRRGLVVFCVDATGRVQTARLVCDLHHARAAGLAWTIQVARLFFLNRRRMTPTKSGSFFVPGLACTRPAL